MVQSPTDKPSLHTTLPAFRKYRPLSNADSAKPRSTVRDIFGVDGWFFDLAGPATSKPRTFAVLLLPGTCTPSGWGWAVRGVDRDRRQYGPLALTRRDAVHGAAPHLHAKEPTALVRAEGRQQSTVLHVRCACTLPEAVVKAEFTDFISTAEWLDEDFTASWRFCTSTPKRITWNDGTGTKRRGAVWRTYRHHNGWVTVSIRDDFGCYPKAFLRDLAPDSI
ncbi:hypothetical protein [Streptomyces tendae]|uniref:hypothetical protein n=1 Tax=Streptomyces tendae TaxID=1932 RepID=UPI0036C8E517